MFFQKCWVRYRFVLYSSGLLLFECCLAGRLKYSVVRVVIRFSRVTKEGVRDTLYLRLHQMKIFRTLAQIKKFFDNMNQMERKQRKEQDRLLMENAMSDRSSSVGETRTEIYAEVSESPANDGAPAETVDRLSPFEYIEADESISRADRQAAARQCARRPRQLEASPLRRPQSGDGTETRLMQPRPLRYRPMARWTVGPLAVALALALAGADASESLHPSFGDVSSSPMSNSPLPVADASPSPSAATLAATSESHPIKRYEVMTIEFARVETPFIIGLWIFCSSLAKIGKFFQILLQSKITLGTRRI
ncbi:unnamed protein product [Nesidiocoris tenuis]|uniref:Uncharacterized protein n=1 Tax=Nesidiocoris tenuis TaxID=355587 RepID=A0A6H5H9V8_9HEMI|nr:unnamed protein product [Nesidiocoris tenuis]